MASNVAVVKGGPLSFMTKIDPTVLIWRPEDSASVSGPSPASTAPRLILIGGWMDARDVHLAKYVTRYQALYPASGILLIKCPIVHMLSPKQAVRAAAAAVRVIKAANLSTAGSGGKRPELLIHLFSNGGSTALAHLYALYGSPLPPHATIFDSAPGQFTWAGSWTALTMGLSLFWKVLAFPFVTALITWYYVLALVRPPDGLSRVAAAHNDRKGGNGAELRRAYVYSREDRLVGWRAVEGHAADAERKGFAVRRERFAGSPHVAHARADEERYWRIVKETWGGP